MSLLSKRMDRIVNDFNNLIIVIMEMFDGCLLSLSPTAPANLTPNDFRITNLLVNKCNMGRNQESVQMCSRLHARLVVLQIIHRATVFIYFLNFYCEIAFHFSSRSRRKVLSSSPGSNCFGLLICTNRAHTICPFTVFKVFITLLCNCLPIRYVEHNNGYQFSN